MPPHGYCQCGCGQKTAVSNRNDYRDGYAKGDPRKFVRGHAARLRVPGPRKGRDEARRLYTLGPCERCGALAVDRHHKDEDVDNNDASNIEILCRRCHMRVDGRLEKLREMPGRSKEPPKPCSNCGRPYKPLRRRRCSPCRTYFDKYGRERPQRLWKNGAPRIEKSWRKGV
jgi:hypothetical protein